MATKSFYLTFGVRLSFCLKIREWFLKFLAVTDNFFNSFDKVLLLGASVVNGKKLFEA